MPITVTGPGGALDWLALLFVIVAAIWGAVILVADFAAGSPRTRANKGKGTPLGKMWWFRL